MIGLHTPVATAIKVAVTCAISGAIYIQPYRAMMFDGKSMEPTYQSGSIVITEPVSPAELEKGMVVIVNMDSGPIVKRIALMPGEKVLQTKTGGQWFDMITIQPQKASSLRKIKWRERTIPDGTVYVLGDNLCQSEDSRIFGTVQMSQITRKVVDQRPFDPFAQHGWGDSSAP